MTVHRYLNLLEISCQVVRLEPYAINRTKRLIKTPRLYWNDSGLAMHLAHGGAERTPTGQPGMRDISGLRTFLDEHPKQALGGVVVHGGDESYWLDDRIVALPWWRVM